MKSINDEALEIISPILDAPEHYQAKIIKSDIGATIIDMGLSVDGSWRGGKLWVLAAHGGMADVNYGRMSILDLELPTVDVMVDDPMLSVVACQAGAWKLGKGEFSPVGSGPARLKARADRFARLVEYEDPSNHALLQLQMNRLPDDATLQFVADACGIPASNLVVMVAPSASIVGTIQVVGRSFEQAIISLGRNTDFDLSTCAYGYGRAPIPPVINDEVLAMGRINDALVYGSFTSMWVRYPDDDELRQITNNMSFSNQAGEDYGKGYAEIYDTYGRSLFNIPARLDSPAKIMMTNLLTGKVTIAGRIDEKQLYDSFTTT